MRDVARCILALAVVSAACSPALRPDGGSGARTGPLAVTATTGMIADAAKRVGGEHVTVTGLMGPGVDPHLYKATQGDLQKLSSAELILYNGLHLEGRMADILVKMATRVPTIQVTDSIPEDLLREPPEFAGQYDPHVWYDLSLWIFVVERIRDAFSEQDPSHAAEYAANAQAFTDELKEMHEYTKEQVQTLPEEARVLVTAHDAFGYFGRAYGLEVKGLQGISTASEYGLQDVDTMVDELVDENIKAVFIESSISQRSIDALVTGAKAKGHDLRIGGTLYSDALGEAGTPEATLLGAFKHNVDTIVKALL
jgi:manganese/zinc/iron transport system substrate-binding protein